MKKLLIGSLVGALIIFIWQAASWMVLPIHKEAFKRTASQDALLQNITQALKEDGQYMLPMPPENYTQQQEQDFMKTLEGKPWATITYHSALKSDMVMSIIRGFLIEFLCVLIALAVVRRQANKSFGSVFWSILAFGAVSFLYVWYNGHNWMDIPWSVIKGELIDSLVSWGLCGIWLGWYIGRKQFAKY